MSALLDLLITGIQSVYALRYAELASSTIVVYDHLITIDDEIDLIWKSSWSMGKVLFIVNRYYTLAAVIVNNYGLFGTSFSTTFCHGFFRWQGWTGLIACMIAEIILQMRLYALYFLDRKILIMMVATFIVTSASSAAIMGIVLSQMTASAVPIPIIGTFCLPIGVPNWFYTFWIPILTFETLLCVLALVKGIQTFRASGSPFQSGRKLVGILIRDSVVYYLVMFATYLTCLLVWVLGTNQMLEIPIGFSIAMSCVLGNRVILNVRLANRDIEQSKVAAASSNHPPGFDQQQAHAQSWRSLNHVGSRISQGAVSILKTASRHEHGKEVDEDDHIDTLTDMEMAQLRSMRAETPGQDGFIVI